MDSYNLFGRGERKERWGKKRYHFLYLIVKKERKKRELEGVSFPSAHKLFFEINILSLSPLPLLYCYFYCAFLKKLIKKKKLNKNFDRPAYHCYAIKIL